MSSIVIHIRFQDHDLAKILDGIEKLQLDPPRSMNDIIRIAVFTGLAVMNGANWQNTPPSASAVAHLATMTRQNQSASHADQIIQALQDKTSQPPEPVIPTIWTSIDISTTISSLDPPDQEKALKVFAMMSDGHISPEEQLTSNDGTIDRLASFILFHNQSGFPELLELITSTYNKYWKED